MRSKRAEISPGTKRGRQFGILRGKHMSGVSRTNGGNLSNYGIVRRLSIAAKRANGANGSGEREKSAVGGKIAVYAHCVGA